MSKSLAGKPFKYNGTTITPILPILEEKGEDILEIQKRDKHVIITFPESVQKRFESKLFSRLPMKPSLAPFRFRGRLCFFIDNADFYDEDKQTVRNVEDGTYQGKVHLQIPSINEKDGETYLKIKLVSILLFKKPCPW